MNFIFTSTRKAFSILTLALAFLFGTNSAIAQLPHPDHIVVLIEENQPKDWVIGTSSVVLLGNAVPTSYAPYTNLVANDTASAILTSMYALEHPSQGNYLQLFAGGNQGVLDDNLPLTHFSTPNLARQLLDKGLTFKTYSEDLPSTGSDIERSGLYARKHNPVANWMGQSINQVPDSLNQPFTAFPTDFTQLPTVSFVVPNEVNDMHDGSGTSAIAAGDTWFQQNLDSYVQWCKTHNSLLIYTFDEDNGFENNNIPTFFLGEMVKTGTYSDNWDLHNILRTIEDIYGLDYAGAASQKLPITNILKSEFTVTGINDVKADKNKISVYPNPSATIVNFASKEEIAGAEVSIFNALGQRVAIEKFTAEKLSVNTVVFANGFYTYRIEREGQLLQTGKISVAH
ncbi:MAG TPA: alkaline phosphatase family protein [Chitinophagales bacterium]